MILLKFAIITDIHFGHPRSPTDPNIHVPQIMERIRNELSLEPDISFIMQLGDLISDNPESPSAEEDRTHFRYVVDLCSKFHVPAFHLIGNHDHSSLSLSTLGRELGYNSLYYSFESGGFQCIVLATISPGNVDIRLLDGELSWFVETLMNSTKPVLVFSHQPIVECDLEESRWFKGRPESAFMVEGKQLQKAIESSGKVRAVFNGHMHWNRKTVKNDIPYFTIQSMVEGMPGGIDASESYAIVTVTSEDISVEVRGKDYSHFRFSTRN